MLSVWLRQLLPPNWRSEFDGYTVQSLQRDLLAGLTVGAVAPTPPPDWSRRFSPA
jgi:hypothetical protein